MIRILKRGNYRLVEVKNYGKVFVLDSRKKFIWHDTTSEIFNYSLITLTTLITLAAGKYFLYEVSKEKEFSDTQHLELFHGKGIWKGYLLPDGLPTKKKQIKKFIPTLELITRTYA